jgi:hypothetical protein
MDDREIDQSVQHVRSEDVHSCPEPEPMAVDPVGLDALTEAAESIGNPRDELPRSRLLDDSGNELCTICRVRLNQRDNKGRVKPKRSYGDGHAHDSCIKQQQRRQKKRTSPELEEPPTKRQRLKDPDQHAARQRAVLALDGITRTLKPYADLERSQRSDRGGILTSVLRGLSMTLDDFLPKFVLSVEKCASFDNHQLKRLRDVFPMPSHTYVNKKRVEMANQYGCGTNAFSTEVRGESNLVHVAYVTDPITLLSKLKEVRANKDQEWKCIIGADKGGDLTKIGITYPTHRIERNTVVWDFLPFILTTGSDDWDGLNVIRSDQFKFTSLSTGYSDYCQVCQQIINDHGGLFGGDWNSTNAVLGLSTASASHPCFSCTVHLRNLLSIAPSRTEDRVAINTLYVLEHPSTVPNMNHSVVRLPHLTVPYTHIVPTPLHVFLGLCNRLVDFFQKFTSPGLIASLKAEVKGHAKPTGASNVYDLNGPQLSKFIRGKYVDRVVQEYLGLHPSRFSLKQLIRIRTAGEWMKQIHDYLLHSRMWTSEEIEAFIKLKESMWTNWTNITGDAPTPKLHMLQHCVEFASNHRVLGRYSEAQLESCHADANRAFERVHLNKINDPPVRIRRTLVTLVTKQLTPQRPKRSRGIIAP